MYSMQSLSIEKKDVGLRIRIELIKDKLHRDQTAQS